MCKNKSYFRTNGYSEYELQSHQQPVYPTGYGSLPRGRNYGAGYTLDDGSYHRPSSAMSRSYYDDPYLKASQDPYHPNFLPASRRVLNRSTSQLTMRPPVSSRHQLRTQRSLDYHHGVDYSNNDPYQQQHDLSPSRSVYSDSYKVTRRGGGGGYGRRDSILKNGYGSARARMHAARAERGSAVLRYGECDQGQSLTNESNPSQFLLRSQPPIKADLNYGKQQLQQIPFHDVADTTASATSYELTPLSHQQQQLPPVTGGILANARDGIQKQGSILTNGPPPGILTNGGSKTAVESCSNGQVPNGKYSPAKPAMSNGSAKKPPLNKSGSFNKKNSSQDGSDYPSMGKVTRTHSQTVIATPAADPCCECLGLGQNSGGTLGHVTTDNPSRGAPLFVLFVIFFLVSAIVVSGVMLYLKSGMRSHPAE